MSALASVCALLLDPSLESYEFLPLLPAAQDFVYESGHLGISARLVKQLLFSVKDPRILAMLLPELPDSWLALRKEVSRSTDADELAKWLAWNALVLGCHKKSGDAWDFRRFVAGLLGESLPRSELDFVARHCELHAHNFYALQYFSEIGNLFSLEEISVFFGRLLRRTPLHYGVYHHLVREFRAREISVDFAYWAAQVGADFRESESFQRFASLLEECEC